MLTSASTAWRRRAAVFRASIVLSLVLLAACEASPATRPLPDPTPRTQQPALRPRANTTAPPTTANAAPATIAESPPAADAPAFVQVAVGENHSCALQNSGRVQCWGKNDDGQLDVPEGVRFQQITAGYRFSCGIRADGGISCWGRNNHRQIEAPDGRFNAIDAGWDHVCALSEGSATCWGWNANERATPPQDVPFAAIGAGAEHSCGLTLRGDLVCWGKNDDGQAASRSGPFHDLAVGAAHTCVLHQNGMIACQGKNDAGQSSPPVTEFTQITSGSMHGCGIASDNSLRCWGQNTDPTDSTVLPVPSGEFTSVTAGWNTTCAVRPGEPVQCWNYSFRTARISPYHRLIFVYYLPSTTYAEPVDIAPWPYGGILVAERHGQISLVENGTSSRTLLDLNDELFIEGGFSGLLSIAVAPEFEEFPYLYAYFTAKQKHPDTDRPSVRLARFPIVDGRAVKDEGLIVLDLLLPPPAFGDYGFGHYGGTIRFGPDGMLYISMGDADCFECPQTLDSLFGKIIRIDVRGATVEQPYRTPDDNPFLQVSDARPEVWALGLRNPWRMAIDSQQGTVWVGDVGHDSEEEVSIVTAGANLGWPVFEGSGCVTVDESVKNHYGIETGYACEEFEDAIQPVVSYEHTGSVCAVVGGLVYRGREISWLDGAYLFGDHCSGQIWALEGDADRGWQMIQIADLPNPLISFGTDAAGEVYVLMRWKSIQRLVGAEDGSGLPAAIVPTETAVSPGTGDK